jgi:hypothetical protein
LNITAITTALAATAATAGAAGIISAPIAFAEDDSIHTLGTQAKLVDGNIIQGWTINNLKTSSDVIPYPVNGTLWEATATDEAIQGSATPIVSNLNARARSGQTYRVLFQVPTPQGVNPATLQQGQKTSGKVYFDVTGESPDSVVYNAGGQDLLVWVQPPPAARESIAAPARSRPTPAPAATQPTPAPAAPAPTPAPAASPGTPAPAGLSEATPAPAGSQGTPLPAGSQGTPLPAGSQGMPAPAAATEGAPLPASTEGAPAPEGSQGTPLPAGDLESAAPTTTTVVPPPA